MNPFAGSLAGLLVPCAMFAAADSAWRDQLPSQPAGIGRPAADRGWWGPWAAAPEAANAIRRAADALRQPLQPFDAERYQDYVRNGDRSRFQSLNGKRWERLRTLVLGECLENKGRFTAAIDETARGLCGDPSWLLPAHDHGARVFGGAAPYVDLAVAMNGFEMALAAWLLEDRLPPATVATMRAEVRRRLTVPVLGTIDGTAPKEVISGNFWARANHNWNAVCTAGTTGAILATETSRETRAKVVVWARKNTGIFLSGFGKDGYCSEGIGYWSYGFGHFLVLAETLRQQTGGQLDLYADESVKRVAAAVPQLEIAGGIFPAFADCSLRARPDPQALALVRWRLDRQALPGTPGAVLTASPLLYQTLLELSARRESTGRKDLAVLPLPPRSWFPASGVFIARPAIPGALAAAWKGGHNAEHHNHNDVGSTVVVWQGEPLLADLGAMVYRAETFSGERYRLPVHSSFGHSLPVPAGWLQESGRNAAAKLLAMDTGEGRDTMTMDLCAAYPKAGLTKLERQWTYSRGGAGQLAIEDRFAYAKPAPFATALVGLGDWSLVQRGEKQARFALTGARGTALEVAAECSAPATWKVVRIDNPGKTAGNRLGIELAAPAAEGFVRLTVKPRPDAKAAGEKLPVAKIPEKLADPRRAP